MNQYLKQQPLKPVPTVRELVAKWGDDWALMGSAPHWSSVLQDKGPDYMDGFRMRQYERGQKSRIRREDVL